MPQGLEYKMDISLVQQLAAVTHVAGRKGEGYNFYGWLAAPGCFSHWFVVIHNKCSSAGIYIILTCSISM